jgi:DNA-binding PadR family transcriptional regulator
VALTGRRRIFLQTVLNMYREGGKPVHYTTVAQEIRVSRWTAYDILRRLERDGYLEAVYETGKKERGPGRTQVLFRPAAKAAESGKSQPADWKALRTRLMVFIRHQKRAAGEMAAELVRDFPKIPGRLAKSASDLVVLLSHLYEIGVPGRRALAKTVARARQPEHGLSLFTGAAVGSLLHTRGLIPGPVGECVTRLQRQLGELSAEEARFLAGFVKDGLSGRPIF